MKLIIFLNLLLCGGCSFNNNESQYEEKGETEESGSISLNPELEKILESDMHELMETQDFQISNDRFIRVFDPEYYPCAVAEDSTFYLVCTSYYNENQPPTYIVFKEEYIEEYLEKIGLEKGMDFSDIMKAWGDSEVFERSYDDTVQKKYKIEYKRDGLRYLFVSEDESGKGFVLYIGLPKDGSDEKEYYQIPSDDDIKSFLNMTEQELEEMTGTKIDESSLIVFETTLAFPVLFPQNTSYWFVCTSRNTSFKPKYFAFYGNYEKEYLRQLGLKNCRNFEDIMEVMGNTEVIESKTREEMEAINIDDYQNYMIQYEKNGLQYNFIADNVEGKSFTLYIGLGNSDEGNRSEMQTEKDDVQQATALYEEFLNGERNVEGISNIDDIAIPIGRTDIHYLVKYAYCDSNGDAIPELHIKSGRYYFVISYRDNELFVWKNFSSYESEYFPLSNGAFLVRKDDAVSSPGVIYRYTIFKQNGDEMFEITFSKANSNECSGYDANDDYIYNGISVSQEMWNELTEKYFYQDSNGRLIITDEVNWNVLYE